MKTRLCFSMTLALAVAAVGAGDAAASLPSKIGVLSMTPAQRRLVAGPPVTLSPTRLANTTKLTMKVHVFTAELTQALSGTFGIKEAPKDLTAAKLVLPVTPQDFTMRPGDVNHVQMHWSLVPRGKQAVYMGLIIQGTPQLPRGKALGQILRLLGTNFLVLPGHHRVTGSLTKLQGRQAAPRVIEFLPRVHNTGQIHSQPRGGRCAIVDSNGGVRFRARFGRGDGIVLPGYSREYPIVLRHPQLPAGSYTMRCTMRFGRTHSTIAYPFRLSAPNTLPTANLKLTTVGASGEIGGSARVKVSFRNNGTKASATVLKLALRQDSPGAPRVVARLRAPEGTLAGGQSKTTTLSVGKLVRGNYEARVILSDGTTDVDELSAAFAAVPHRGLVKRIVDWLKHHWALLLALLLLLLLLIVILLWRRQRRELEEQLQATAPPPPPPPPPAARAERIVPIADLAPPARSAPAPHRSAPAHNGRVNVNSADADELMRLPSVGRRAAERLIVHRTSHGPFRTLDDLGAVEGFHQERIDRIRELAEV